MTVPTTSLGRGKSNAICATTTAAAAAMPPPSQALRWAKILRLLCSVMVTLLIGSRRDVPNDVCPSTRRPGKGWRAASRPPGVSGIAAAIEATSPSGACSFGIAPKASNRRFQSSNSARAAGSAASRTSRWRASASLASLSRTACISSVSGECFRVISLPILEQAAQAAPRLEQAGLHGLLVDLQDLRHLFVAAFREVAQRQHQPVARRHGHHRVAQLTRQLGGARLPLGAGTLVAGNVDVVLELVLVAVAAQQVERLIDGDPVDPAEELVFR